MGREMAAVDLVRPDQRGRLLSSFFGISSVGTTLGPVIGGVIMDLLNFRAVFVVYTAMAIVVLLISTTIQETRPERQLQSGGRKRAFLGVVRLREIDPYYRTTFVVLIMGTFGAMVRHSTLNSMLPLYASTRLGLSGTEIGSLFGVAGMVTLASLAPAGFISDKIGRKAAIVPATILSGIAFAGYPFAHSLLQLAILSGLIGVSNGLSMGSMTTYTFDIVPDQTRGQFQAIRRTSGEAGGVGGPLVGGVIANAFHPGMVFLFYSPLYLVTALLLLLFARESMVKGRLRSS